MLVYEIDNAKHPAERGIVLSTESGCGDPSKKLPDLGLPYWPLTFPAFIVLYASELFTYTLSPFKKYLLNVHNTVKSIQILIYF